MKSIKRHVQWSLLIGIFSLVFLSLFQNFSPIPKTEKDKNSDAFVDTKNWRPISVPPNPVVIGRALERELNLFLRPVSRECASGGIKSIVEERLKDYSSEVIELSQLQRLDRTFAVLEKQMTLSGTDARLGVSVPKIVLLNRQGESRIEYGEAIRFIGNYSISDHRGQVSMTTLIGENATLRLEVDNQSRGSMNLNYNW